MIKLFKNYKKKNSERSLWDIDRVFLLKVSKFFDEIVHKDDRVVRSTTSVCMDNDKSENYLISIMVTSDILVRYGNENDIFSIKYPFIVEYISSEISKIAQTKKLKTSNWYEVDINEFDKKSIKKINFSKKEYDIYKESERFGL